jgi:hypothetical protein
MKVTRTPLELATLFILAFFYVSCCCSALPGRGGSMQPWFFSLRNILQVCGFLTFLSMRISLPLNQRLALVACGLFDSQDVMMFLELCIYGCILGFLWWLF